MIKPVPDAVSPEQIFELGKQLDKPYNILFYLIYLTGGRISEVLLLRKQNFEEVLYAGSLQRLSGSKAISVKLTTLKNRTRLFRTLPLLHENTKLPLDPKMLDVVILHVQALKQPDWLLFAGITRKKAWYRFHKITFQNSGSHGKEYIDNKAWAVHPHYLRHVRVEHLLKYHGLSESYLTEYFGWTDSRQIQRYKGAGLKPLWEQMASV